MEKHAEAALAGWRFHGDDVDVGARLLASTPASSPDAALSGPRRVRVAGHHIHAERHLAWRSQREPREALGLSAAAVEALRGAQETGQADRESHAREALSRAYSDEVGALVDEWGRRARAVDTRRCSGDLPTAATAGLSWLAALDAMDTAIAAAEAHQRALAKIMIEDQPTTDETLDPPIDLAPVREMRHAIMRALGDALARPRSQLGGAPDYRGAVEFALAEALGRAIASGDNIAMDIAFPNLLASALRTAHGPRSGSRPSGEVDRSVGISPLLAAIALSGIALAHADLYAHGGVETVRAAWRNAGTREWTTDRQAQAGLDALDEEKQSHLFIRTWRWYSMALGWQESLAQAITNHGFASDLSGEPVPPPREAPSRIRIMGAIAPPYPTFRVGPAEMAGALILAPLSGETDERLRARPGLRVYFETIDAQGESSHRRR